MNLCIYCICFYHTPCVYYWRPLDHSGENFIYYNFVNQGEKREFPRPPYTTAAYYNNLKDTITKINLFKLLFLLWGLLGKLLFKKTKLEHDLKMLLSGIQLRK